MAIQLTVHSSELASKSRLKQCGSSCSDKGVREQKRLVEQPLSSYKHKSGANAGEGAERVRDMYREVGEECLLRFHIQLESPL